MADGLLNKASIILTPTGYKAGTLYNVAPIDEPYEDFDFARTSTATRINSSGLVSNVATGVPRISYDSNGDNGHILLEPTSTNVFVYSEDFSNWNGYQATSNTTTAPDGSTITFLDFEDARMFPTTTVSNSTEYTSSIYLKANKTADVKLRSVADNDTVITLTTDWVRYDLTATTSSTSTNALLIDARFSQGLGASGLEIALWGGQIEALSYATSYIPTLTGSTETRATETATGAGSADLINSTEGVLYAEIAALDDGISQQIGVYGNSTSKQLRIEIDNSVIRAQLFNGAYQANMSSTQTVTNFNKIAFKWKVNDFALWINGTEVATDSSGSTFPANDLDRLNLSGQNGIASSAQAKIKSLAVFNEALSDSELTQLTT